MTYAKEIDLSRYGEDVDGCLMSCPDGEFIYYSSAMEIIEQLRAQLAVKRTEVRLREEDCLSQAKLNYKQYEQIQQLQSRLDAIQNTRVTSETALHNVISEQRCKIDKLRERVKELEDGLIGVLAEYHEYYVGDSDELKFGHAHSLINKPSDALINSALTSALQNSGDVIAKGVPINKPSEG